MIHGKAVGWVALAAAACALAAVPVRGDVATPRPRWTKVRLVSEEVNIKLGDERIEVAAVFEMHNTGEKSVARMGYPVGLFEEGLNEFAVTVDGEPLADVRTEAAPAAAAGEQGSARKPVSASGGAPTETYRIEGPQKTPGRTDVVVVEAEAYRFEGPYKAWKVFDVPFDADGKKTIGITYWVRPFEVEEVQEGAMLLYSYTLKTGATWRETIDKAVIRVTLEGVELAAGLDPVPAGCTVSEDGKVLTWTMKDFKPAEDIEIKYRRVEG